MKHLNFCQLSRSCLPRKIRSFLIIMGIVVILCQFLGCRKSTPPPPPDKIVNTALKDTNNSRFSSELRREIEVYVDASASMRGFVNSQGETSFSRLMRGLASFPLPGYRLSFFKFGTSEPQNLSLQRFWQMSTHKKLFDQTSTRLDSMIRSFLNEENPASAYLVVTDGVQASPIGCDYPSFVNLIDQWLEEKNNILHVYAFRSKFNGIIYSANVGNHFHYESDPHDPGSFRPFYVYVFILDKNLDERVIATMQNIIQDFGVGVDYHFINFSDKIIKKGALDKRALDFGLPVKLQREDKNKTRFRRYYTKEVRGKSVIFLRWLDKKRGQDEGYLTVKFRLNLTDFAKKISQGLDRRIIRDVKIWHWEREKKVIRNPNGRTKIDYRWVPQEIPNADRYLSDLEFLRIGPTLRFQRMPESGWYSYYIRLLPADSAFQIPDWVKDWSTMDDSTSENANRTLNFMNIVSSILNNAPIRKRTLADFFVAINFR